MGHETKGVGVDDGGLILGGLVGLGDFTVGIHQFIGLSGFQIGVGSGTASEDRAVSTNVHGNAQELLICGADDISAVAGALGEGVGITVFILVGAVCLHGLIVAGEIHGGVDYVELHVGAGVCGEDGPAGCGGLAVDDVHGGVVALQIGASGSPHNTKDPWRGNHGVLRGGVLISVVKGAAVRVKLGIPNGKSRAGVSKQGHVGNAGYIDVRVLYGELGAFAKRGDGGALAGEVAGLKAIAIGVEADGGLGNGIVDAAGYDNSVKAGVRAVDGHVFSLGTVIDGTVAQRFGNGLFVYNTVFVDVQCGMVGIVIVCFVSAAGGKGGKTAGVVVQIIGIDNNRLVGVGIYGIAAVKPGDLAIYQQCCLLPGGGGNVGSGTGIGGTGGSQRRGGHQGGA